MRPPEVSLFDEGNDLFHVLTLWRELKRGVESNCVKIQCNTIHQQAKGGGGGVCVHHNVNQSTFGE